MNMNNYLKILFANFSIRRLSHWAFHALDCPDILCDSNALEAKEPVWTGKAKVLYWLANVLYMVSIISICWFLPAVVEMPALLPLYVLIVIFVMCNIYIFLILALLIIKPYEIINRLRVKFFIQNKIQYLKQNKQLTVIGITGSYGKTSTKMILHELLPKSLITPKSFNTLFGIYKVVDYELNDHYRFFVCEMGAYKRGDVKEFCQLALPNIGVLTGINEQHLERFGSIENTIQAKFEILAGTTSGGTCIVNLDNQLVRENLPGVIDKLRRANITLIGYTTEGQQSTECKEILAIRNWKIENGHSICELIYKDSNFSIKTALLGRGHLSNILASTAVCLSAGEPINEIIARIARLKQIPHRLELRSTPGLSILDDTYSSNPTGFRESLDVLAKFNNSAFGSDAKKVLITPGIVELGEKAIEIHKELGTIAGKLCDEIVLVGKSKQIEAMQEGILQTGFQASKIIRLPGRNKVQELLRDRANSHEVILMENDLPDQYL